MYARYVKRMFDICLALLLLVLLAPLFLILILCISFKLGRPVFFTQKRGGIRNSVFNLYKFRSMTSDCDEHGNLLSDDKRLPPFGKMLRKYSFDELPSLFNILRGEISFIGPRPFIADYLNYYNDFQKQRHNVYPGMTGWAQINGRNALTWEEKFELDVWYVKNMSFSLDVKIFALTFAKLFKPQGISNEQHVTMPRFTGTKVDVLH
jgi:sugar transferase EpsL